MAISAPVLLDSGTVSTSAATQATNSFTTSATKLTYLAVAAHPDGGPSFCTCTGWAVDEQVSFDPTGSGETLTVLRKMGSGTGTHTIDFGVGNTQHTIDWIVFEVDGVDTSGSNGAGAIRQSEPATGNSAAAAVTLAAFGAAGNATLAITACDGGGQPITLGTGFSLIAEVVGGGGVPVAVECAYQLGNDTSVTAGLTASAPWGIVGIELVAAVAAGHPTMRRWGGVPGMTNRNIGRAWG